MTRKDYVAIARVISDGQFINLTTQGEVTVNHETRIKIARQLADLMGRDNQRFDRSRFLNACGFTA